MTAIDPTDLDRRALNGLLNALVAPRPIAWVSTVDPDGRRNLAPFSYFNLFSYSPPVVAFGPGRREGVGKDTLKNVEASGELVINMVSRELAEVANLTSANVDPEVDEWELAGLEPEASDLVRPPRVKVAPAAFECSVLEVVDLGRWTGTSTNALVVAAVMRVHLADDLYEKGLPPAPADLALVARLGGDAWCTTADVFRQSPPDATAVIAAHAAGRDGGDR